MVRIAIWIGFFCTTQKKVEQAKSQEEKLSFNTLQRAEVVILTLRS
jgi:hypothetical protein